MTALRRMPVLAFCFLLITVGRLQGQPVETLIKKAGMDMMQAFLQKDYDKFLGYMDPGLVKLAGGRDSLLQKIDTASKIASRFGAKVTRITIGNPYKVVEYKGQLQATLPETTEMSFFNGKIELETTLIALSDDQGKHWHFIDTHLYSMESLHKNLPGLSPDLIIPPPKKPVFTAREE